MATGADMKKNIVQPCILSQRRFRFIHVMLEIYAPLHGQNGGAKIVLTNDD